uniref:Uncharacterized protein n=1 Tax=Sphaerodactylus townsendi TaxID=933632 RepID=A0ACB8EE12_9SAUR
MRMSCAEPPEAQIHLLRFPVPGLVQIHNAFRCSRASKRTWRRQNSHLDLPPSLQRQLRSLEGAAPVGLKGAALLLVISGAEQRYLW